MATANKVVRDRRNRVPDKPNKQMSLWAVVKNFVGKEMTRVSMPVNFSEPLSMLQRLTEDYEYSEVLDKAAKIGDDLEQMAYVAAYIISCYANTCDRTTKPFNPLLGETFECDRISDFGWRSVAEQVIHHPPTMALHCESKDWIAWQDFTMTSKFKGKYILVQPDGVSHLEFKLTSNHYTWNKVTTTVHNVILGKLWVDHGGTLLITNHKTGAIGKLTFLPFNFLDKKQQRRVEGTVSDKDGNVKWIVSGWWDQSVSVARVISVESNDNLPVYKTDAQQTVWIRKSPPADSSNYYYFTLLACQLNEPEDGVAPTDSRLRPDQRLMEQGMWDEANRVKLALEEKQRNARRQLAKTAKGKSVTSSVSSYKPTWFELQLDPLSGKMVHKYKGEYWKCKDKKDWSRCPDIYSLPLQ